MIGQSRRTVLGGIGGALLALAGCTGGSPRSGAFTRTAVEGQELIVEFDEDLGPETIAVIDPDGESFAETPVSTGATRVSFDIEIPYKPGEYEVLATDGDDVIKETTVDIAPALEVVDVGVGANRMDEMHDDLGVTKASEAIITIRNRGTGPEEIAQLLFLGDLPNPNDPQEDRVGIFDPEESREARDPILLAGGEDLTLFSSTLPFSFGGDGINCQADPQTGQMEVRIRGRVEEQISHIYHIEYTASGSYDGCDIVIQEEI